VLCQRVQLTRNDDIVKSDTECRERSCPSPNEALALAGQLSSRLRKTSSYFRGRRRRRHSNYHGRQPTGFIQPLHQGPFAVCTNTQAVHAAHAALPISREIGEHQPGKHRQSLGLPTPDRVTSQQPTITATRASKMKKGTGINANKSANCVHFTDDTLPSRWDSHYSIRRGEWDGRELGSQFPAKRDTARQDPIQGPSGGVQSWSGTVRFLVSCSPSLRVWCCWVPAFVGPSAMR